MKEIVVPKVGLTIEEVEIVEWLVAVDDEVELGQPIVVVNADKTEVEVAAETAGVIAEIGPVAGDVVAVGGVLGRFAGPSTDDASPSTSALAPPDAAAVTSEVTPVTVDRRTERRAPESTRLRASPFARRVAREAGISLSGIVGSGPNGRVVARDVVVQQPSSVPSVPDGRSVGGQRQLTLRASVDVAEALGVIAASRSDVRLSDIVLVALERARRSTSLANLPVAVGQRLDGEDALLLPVGALTDVTSAAGARRDAGPPGDVDRLMLVDLTEGEFEVLTAPTPHGVRAMLTVGAVEWWSRERRGELVERPRVAVTIGADTGLVAGDVVAELLRTLAFDLSRAGDLLVEVLRGDRAVGRARY